MAYNIDNVAKSLGELAALAKQQSVDTKKKPKFFFSDNTKSLMEVSGRIDSLEEELAAIGFRVEVLENLECFNVTHEKRFNIRIYDNNNTYSQFSLDGYMAIVNDFNRSVEDYLCNEIVKITGGKKYNVMVRCDVKKKGDPEFERKEYNTKMIADLIAEALSYMVYFRELQTKSYTTIGWSEYDNYLVFKYDKMYANTSSYLLRGKCEGSFAEDIKPVEEGENREKKEIEWFNTIKNIMNDSALASLILAAGISGLIRQILPFTKETNINMNIVGNRATGKSTICHFLLSIFGDPSKLEASYSDTVNSMEVARAEKPVLPYVMDERMLSVEGESDEKKKRALIIDIFREYEGKVKERLGGSYKKISGNRTTGPVISSSVESMMDILISSSDLGQFRRFIEIVLTEENWIFRNKEMAEKTEAVAYSCYGYGIQMIIKYMLSRGTDIDQLTGYFNYKFESYNKVITEQIKLLEKENNISGLSSSSKRLALILTSYEVLRNSLLYWISTILEVENSNGIDIYNSGYEELRPFEEMIDRDDFIIDKSFDIGFILLENLFGKMEGVAAYQVPINKYWEYIEKYKSAFWIVGKGKTAWEGDNRAEYIGKLEETETEYIIKILGKEYYTHYLILERVEPVKIKEYITLKENQRITGTGEKEAIAVTKFAQLTPNINNRTIEVFLSKNKDITVGYSSKKELFAKRASNSAMTIIRIKKPVNKKASGKKSTNTDKKEEKNNEDK